MKLDRILNDICTYTFLQLKYSLNIRTLKTEISRYISHIVQSARIHADGRSTIQVLRQINLFSLTFKSIIPLAPIQSWIPHWEFRNGNSSIPRLVIRENTDRCEVIQIFPFSNTFDITFSVTLVRETLALFKLTKVIDVCELSDLIRQSTSNIDKKLNYLDLEESLKTEILCYHTSSAPVCDFITIALKVMDSSENRIDLSVLDDSSCLLDESIDTIIGRNYITRGKKRSYVEDPISIEPNQNRYRKMKKMKEKRDLLHLKDTYHLIDSALKAIFQYVKDTKKLYSLVEIERLRKETNAKFPLCGSSTSAYVKFEYAVRTAIFVALK